MSQAKGREGRHIFTGFGFGPIQAGLFVKEASYSGNFQRLVVSEVDPVVVDAVRANMGSYYVNIAKADGIEAVRIDNVELLNPDVDAHRRQLLAALAQSTEIATCLPSVDFYTCGRSGTVAGLIAEGLENSVAEATVIYTAENNNRAAQILEHKVNQRRGRAASGRTQFLNTVIGKMSRVIDSPAEIAELNLVPIAPGISRAFLVEQFNRILVDRCLVSGFKPGMEAFIEKDDLLPFEAAKLYGHNAVHALLAYLGAIKGCKAMSELTENRAVMDIAGQAFLDESGAALIKKYTGCGDELFTKAGFTRYAEDLLWRITNPYLADTIERAGRDVLRKLAYYDRLFGTMDMVFEQCIEPRNMALGAMAGIAALLKAAEENELPADLRFDSWRKMDNAGIEKIVKWVWGNEYGSYHQQIIYAVQKAKKALVEFADS